MGFTKPNLTTSASSSTQKLIIFSFILLFTFPLLLLTFVYPSPYLRTDPQTSFLLPNNAVQLPVWLRVIHATHIASEKPLRLGLVNFEDAESLSQLGLHGINNVDYVKIDFEHVSPNVPWKNYFPEWIDENRPVGSQCPKLPMPEPGRYSGLDVVVAKLPCDEIKKKQEGYINGTQKGKKEGIRDVHRLQLSLATARLLSENVEGGRDEDEDVYAVFVGKCEPMVEIFRCDDLVWHKGEYWVYKPKVNKLKESISMPVGTCDLASPYSSNLGKRQLQGNPSGLIQLQTRRKEAYVTILHSSEDYVCGAIALAQSILQTNTTKDLVLLADRTISSHSIAGLQAAGWKVKRIDRIRSPNARVDAYNEWNYSKLRVWQLTDYDKVMFIDSDLIVLRNVDHFFDFPQLSAAPNSRWIFNSGIMILEPSECFFDYLMSKRYALKSSNGGDQGYLNEVLTWWHRLTKKLNFMKIFGDKKAEDRVVLEDRYTIHFLGMKPWTCYRDYDCNWDRKDYHVYASDAVHARWWQVYDAMTPKLQDYCAMTSTIDSRIRNRRKRAQKDKLADEHWRIKIKDPRQHNLVGSSKEKQRAIS